mgnify:CR=1 FL=1
MRIKLFLHNIWIFFLFKHKRELKDDFDAKYWIQFTLLKNYFKSLNNNN